MSQSMNAYPPMDLNNRDVIGTASGWGGGFHTRSNTPEGVPAIAISPDEILQRLQRLEDLYEKKHIHALFQQISSHLHRKDNPHGITLEKLGSSVTKMLYDIYQSMGFKGNYDFFVSGMFQIFEIASTKDIEAGVDENMLITIKGIKDFISYHNRSIHAHSALFKRLIPGHPVMVEPSLSWCADIFFPAGLQPENAKSLYTYIGRDGYLHTSETATLPTDYTYGEAMIPIWESRSNYIVDSCDVTKPSWYKHNITSQRGGFAIDKTTNGCILTNSNDSSAEQHFVGIKDLVVEANTAYSFSCYFKPDKARFLEFKIQGGLFGVIGSAIFDLVRGTCITTDLGKNFTAEMVPSYIGMWRCGVSWTTNDSITCDISVLPYISSVLTNTYNGNGETLGTIWGGQLEKGVGMSPFIYTTGEYATREAIPLTYEIDDRFTMKEGTLVFRYLAPLNKSAGQQTLYRVYGENNCMIAEYRDKNALMFSLTDVFNSTVWDYPLDNSKSRLRIVSHSFTDGKQTVCATDLLPKETILTAVRNKDATHMDIGHNNGASYLNGYLHIVTFYPRALTKNNHVFLVGA